MLRAAIVTVMLSVVQDSSVDLTTAKTSMKMLTVQPTAASQVSKPTYSCSQSVPRNSQFKILGAARLIKVTGNSESDAYTPANAVVDGGKDSDEPRPNYWLLPSGVSGNPDGKITYTFSSDITINGFYVRNTGGDGESGTQDFTIYVDDEIVVEDELPEPNGDQQLFRFPLEADMKAKSFSLVVKSFHGDGGGLQYFWYY